MIISTPEPGGWNECWSKRDTPYALPCCDKTTITPFEVEWSTNLVSRIREGGGKTTAETITLIPYDRVIRLDYWGFH